MSLTRDCLAHLKDAVMNDGAVSGLHPVGGLNEVVLVGDYWRVASQIFHHHVSGPVVCQPAHVMV